MEREQIRQLLRKVRAGKVGVAEALDQMRSSPVEELGFATLDMHRAVRRGFPEVVYGPGKTTEQIAGIVASLSAAGQTVMVTRVGPDVYQAIREDSPKAVYHADARAVVLRQGRRSRPRPGVLVITAGTADLPVAAEAVLTAELMGNRVDRIHDVGVAGLHRLTRHRRPIQSARVIITVAGMDGILPTVVAGLTDCPVIGVPTSTGYGAGGQGEAALLSMLNSCAAGLTVVNIDNGFGAGYAAALINAPSRPKPPSKKGRR